MTTNTNPLAISHLPEGVVVRTASINNGALPSDGPIRSGVATGGSFRIDPNTGEAYQHGAPLSIKMDPAADRRAIAEQTGSIMATARSVRSSDPITGKSTVIGPGGVEVAIDTAVKLGWVRRTANGYEDMPQAGATPQGRAVAAAAAPQAAPATPQVPLLDETVQTINGLRSSLPAPTFAAICSRAVAGNEDPAGLSGLDNETSQKVAAAVEHIRGSLTAHGLHFAGQYTATPQAFFSWMEKSDPVAARAARRVHLETGSALQAYGPSLHDYLGRVITGRKV